jgi:heme-degrading monooxygenase HmoA
MTISRHWTGIAKKESADEYISHLQNDTFKILGSIEGFIQASIMKRDVEDGVEFLIITEWESLEAIKKFAGADVSTAVVPLVAQAMLKRYDKNVRHYQVHFRT